MAKNRSASGIAAPPAVLRLAEVRWLPEMLASLLAWPLLKQAPRGDGHAVLLIPGLMFGDGWMGLLRRYLCALNYDAQGWAQGRNLGPRPGVEATLLARFEQLQKRSGRKISLVGWSLGGAYARMLALRYPHKVRTVITLGTPITGGADATSARKMYEWVSGQKADDPQQWLRFAPTPEVPTTAIYSRSDAIVAWRASLEQQLPQAENLRVRSSHLGLPLNPFVLYAVAQILARQAGTEKDEVAAFVAPKIWRWYYPLADQRETA